MGWSTATFDDRSWDTPAVIGPVGAAPFTHLYAQRTRIVEAAMPPRSLRTLSSGVVVADFGAVIAGRPSVLFEHGSDGRLVPLRVGYALDPDGHVSSTHAIQGTDLSYQYVQRRSTPADPQAFEPFTFLGFRYLQIDAPGEPLDERRVVARSRHAATPRAAPAAFSSSDAVLDAVYQLSARSALYTSHEQFVDTPTREKGQFLWDGCNGSTREVLAEHESAEQRVTEQLASDDLRPRPPAQLTIFTPLSQPVLEKLREVDLNRLTPLEALNLLAELKKQVD